MRSTFKVLFYVKKGSEKPNGNLPLMCRLTVDGEIKQLSCKIDIPLRLWDVKNNRASGKSAEAQRINIAVDKIRVEVNRRYQELMQTDGYVTAAKPKDAYLGIGVKQETLLKLFEQHNSEFAKKVGQGARDSIQWLQATYGKDNVVAAHLHMDEKTPHIHAAVVPIVTGERRKAKKEQENGKRKYRKKSDTIRLCADDLFNRQTLIAYHDNYARVMAKYGLQRGVRGSEARHTSTTQYYRDMKKKNDALDMENKRLQEQKAEAEQELKRAKKEVQTEKLKGAATTAATNIAESVGSFLGVER